MTIALSASGNVAISRIRQDGALPLLPLEFFRHYWQNVAGPVPELVEVARKADIGAPAVTTGKERRIKRWEHEAVIDAMQDRLDRTPKSMRVRRATVEHPFGTLKAWMGATHLKTRTLEKVRTKMSLHVLAYNLKRVIAILGAQPLMEAMRA